MNNPPAFPKTPFIEIGTPQDGMTLRDYFAAKAMQGMLAACTGWTSANQDLMAKASYMMADAMLKAREQ
jgi:hypothetical protein